MTVRTLNVAAAGQPEVVPVRAVLPCRPRLHTWGCQFWCRCRSCDYCDDPVNERQRVGRWEVTARESMGYICTGGEGNGVNMRGLGLLDPGVAEVECRTPP